MIVTKLFCLGIESPLSGGRYTKARSPAKAGRQASQLQEKHAGGALASDAGGALAIA
jgi:hypothetical protein